MKKIMFFAIAAAGLLASCTSDDNFDANASLSQESAADGRMPIEIGLGKVASVSTRGTGTVGDTGIANNVWKNQKVNILMFKKGTLDLALIDSIKNRYPIYNCTEFSTQYVPGSNKNRAIDMLDSIKYYPAKGQFDFWGYRLDGADAGFEAPTYNVDATGCSYPGDTLKIDFKIDGSQDIMVAKATPSEEDKTDHPDAANRAYSAYSARNGVQPELIFQHLLTRLNFVIVAGDLAATGDKGIFVDKITVKSKTTGKLIAAYKNVTVDDNKRIEWDQESIDTLSLKRRPNDNDENKNLIDLDPVQPTGERHFDTVTNDSVFDEVKIGEALLVAPDSQYDIDIYMHQTVVIKDDGENPKVTDKKEFSTSDVLKLKNGGDFQMGHTYKVAITLYGLSDIQITTTLTGWQEDEIISIKPEDNL